MKKWFVVLLLFWTSVALGTTYTVCADGCDYTSVKDGIVAATSDEDTVYIYDGTYNETLQMINNDAIFIIGESESGTIVNTSYVGSQAVWFTKFLTMSDITWNFTGSSFFYMALGGDIDNVTFNETGTDQYILWVVGAVPYTFDSCTFSSDSWGDINLANTGATSNTFTDCTFTDSRIANNPYGPSYFNNCVINFVTISSTEIFYYVYALNTGRVVMEDCTFTGTEANRVYNYAIQRSACTTAYDSLINCTFSDFQRGYYNATGGATPASGGAYIAGCTFQNIGSVAIASVLPETNIIGNIFTQTRVEDVGLHGILLGDDSRTDWGNPQAEGSIITGNYADIPYGYFVIDKADNILVYGNNVRAYHDVWLKGSDHGRYVGNVFRSTDVNINLSPQVAQEPVSYLFAGNFFISDSADYAYSTTTTFNSPIFQQNVYSGIPIAAFWYENSSEKSFSDWQKDGYDINGQSSSPGIFTASTDSLIGITLPLGYAYPGVSVITDREGWSGTGGWR